MRRLQLVEQDVSREIADLQRGQAGHLRIGVSPGLPEELAGIAAGRLRAEAPRVTFDAMTAATERLAESVSAGELDFALCAIAARPPSELVQELLMEDEFVVYASRTHVLAQRKRLRLTDLSSESWAKSVATQFPWNALENAFERQGLKPPHVAVVSDSTSLRLHAVAASNFLGLISKPFLLRAAPHLDLTKLHLHDARWPRRIGAIYRSQSYVSPAAQRFIHLAKSAARDLAAE